jgi:hypothetical protein
MLRREAVIMINLMLRKLVKMKNLNSLLIYRIIIFYQSPIFPATKITKRTRFMYYKKEVFLVKFLFLLRIQETLQQEHLILQLCIRLIEIFFLKLFKRYKKTMKGFAKLGMKYPYMMIIHP